MVDYHDIGARLRIARESRELSQADVAKRLGITYQRVSQIEKGQGRIPLDVLEKAAAAVGLQLRLRLADPGERVEAMVGKFEKLAPRLPSDTIDMLEAMLRIWEGQQRDTSIPSQQLIK